MSPERLRRTTVEAGKIANGASFDEILTDYPSLEREDILAALASS